MAKKKGKGKGSSSNNNSNSNKNSNNKNTNTNKSNKQKNRKQNKWQLKDDDDTFRESLINQGNTINDMDSDGNCLFRSFSDQLYHDNGAKHDIVRHDICEFLSSNKEEFAGFLLMNDDDEDILDIDEYIEKMREDGEWGGNVEVVVASRVYKRNIVVFSFEYANGALSIVCEDKDKKEDGSDLLLSYHGESHYNSVHPIGGSKMQSTKPKSNDNADATPKHQKKKENEQKDATTTKADSKSRNRPPTRGSSCPCGSGLKYKKCCMASEKSKRRIAKHMKKNNDSNYDDEKKEDSFIGDFKILNI